jgi:hypothetical protein
MKIECPTCQQHIEVEVSPVRRGIPGTAVFALVLCALIGGALGGMFVARSAMMVALNTAMAASARGGIAKKPDAVQNVQTFPLGTTSAHEGRQEAITGALGFILGERLDPSVPTESFENEGMLQAQFRWTNYPPFESVIISTLPDRTIVHISAFAYVEDSTVISTAINQKYGYGTYEGDTESWISGEREIELHPGKSSKDPLFVVYLDKALYKKQGELAAIWRQNKAKNVTGL